MESLSAFDLNSELEPRPRLLLNEQQVRQINEARSKDPILDDYVTRLTRKADTFLEAEPLVYEKRDGVRLLIVSRELLDRVSVLSLAWKLTGNNEYADAGISQLMTVCSFPDWNPSHFLDTAEMATGVGIGFDWLNERLSPMQKEFIRSAFKLKGLRPYLNVHRKVKAGEKGEGDSWWVNDPSNWNLVCNSGILVGLISLTDQEDAEELKQLGEVLQIAATQLPIALTAYEPDGAYVEGVMYWAYASFYSGLGLAVLDRYLDSFNSKDLNDGFLESGNFMIYAHDTQGYPLTYGDSNYRRNLGRHLSALMYFASEHNQPHLAEFYRQRAQLPGNADQISAFSLVWYTKAKPLKKDFLPLDKCFRGKSSIMTWRSDWSDPEALFVGLKGGELPVPHGHLDLGSFEYRVNGYRWIIDLGKENYNLPGFWESGKDGRRWNYFRNATQSHNVPMIDGQQQALNVSVDIERPENKADLSAHMDLSPAYPESRVERTLTVNLEDKVLIVEDLIQPNKQSSVDWGLTVLGLVEINAETNTVTVRQGSKQIQIEWLSEQEGRWSFHPIEAESDRHEPMPEHSFRLSFQFEADSHSSPVQVRIRPVANIDYTYSKK